MVSKVDAQLSIFGISRIVYVYAEYGNIVNGKPGFEIPVFAQLLLHTDNSTVVSVDVSQRFHRFGNDGIAVIIYVGEVFRLGIAIESSGIVNLYPVCILIELDRGVGLIVPVHDGIHQQFADRPFGVIVYGFFPEDGNRFQALFNNCRFDERVKFGQRVEQTSGEFVFIDYVGCVVVAIETNILHICPRQIIFGILSEQENGRIGRTIFRPVVQSEGA